MSELPSIPGIPTVSAVALSKQPSKAAGLHPTLRNASPGGVSRLALHGHPSTGSLSQPSTSALSSTSSQQQQSHPSALAMAHQPSSANLSFSLSRTTTTASSNAPSALLAPRRESIGGGKSYATSADHVLSERMEMKEKWAKEEAVREELQKQLKEWMATKENQKDFIDDASVGVALVGKEPFWFRDATGLNPKGLEKRQNEVDDNEAELLSDDTLAKSLAEKQEQINRAGDILGTRQRLIVAKAIQNAKDLMEDQLRRYQDMLAVALERQKTAEEALQKYQKNTGSQSQQMQTLRENLSNPMGVLKMLLTFDHTAIVHAFKKMGTKKKLEMVNADCAAEVQELIRLAEFRESVQKDFNAATSDGVERETENLKDELQRTKEMLDIKDRCWKAAVEESVKRKFQLRRIQLKYIQMQNQQKEAAEKNQKALGGGHRGRGHGPGESLSPRAASSASSLHPKSFGGGGGGVPKDGATVGGAPGSRAVSPAMMSEDDLFCVDDDLFAEMVGMPKDAEMQTDLLMSQMSEFGNYYKTPRRKSGLDLSITQDNSGPDQMVRRTSRFVPEGSTGSGIGSPSSARSPSSQTIIPELRTHMLSPDGQGKGARQLRLSVSMPPGVDGAGVLPKSPRTGLASPPRDVAGRNSIMSLGSRGGSRVMSPSSSRGDIFPPGLMGSYTEEGSLEDEDDRPSTVRFADEVLEKECALLRYLIYSVVHNIDSVILDPKRAELLTSEKVMVRFSEIMPATRYVKMEAQALELAMRRLCEWMAINHDKWKEFNGRLETIVRDNELVERLRVDVAQLQERHATMGERIEQQATNHEKFVSEVEQTLGNQTFELDVMTGTRNLRSLHIEFNQKLFELRRMALSKRDRSIVASIVRREMRLRRAVALNNWAILYTKAIHFTKHYAAGELKYRELPGASNVDRQLIVERYERYVRASLKGATTGAGLERKAQSLIEGLEAVETAARSNESGDQRHLSLILKELLEDSDSESSECETMPQIPSGKRTSLVSPVQL